MVAPSPRYCFILPDLYRPIGGQTVIYEWASHLEEAGYNVAMVHGGRRHQYTFPDVTPARTYHFPALATLSNKLAQRGVRSRFNRLKHKWRERRAHPLNEAFSRQPGDVFVVPEFAYSEYMALFPDADVIVAVQDAAALMRAFARDQGALHKRITHLCATSDVTVKAVQTLLGREPKRFRLALPIDGLKPDHPKKLQIAYMPRKLRPQSRMITKVLRQRPEFEDVEIVAIDNMKPPERNRIMNESLIFLSFSNMEGFGLPPAEAMAAGCIVIGYTGVGGNDYFTRDTGFPIEHHDMISFLKKVEEVVAAWRLDPTELNTLRQQAATQVRATYRPDTAQQILLEQWALLDGDLRQDKASASR